MIYIIDGGTFVWYSMGSISTNWWKYLGIKLERWLIIGKKKRKKKEKKNRVEFDHLERAVNDHLFTGAIPLLFDAEAFACCVSALENLDFSMFAILTPNLARTPDLHRTITPRNPALELFNDPSLHWITGVRHYARLMKYEQI